MRKVIEWFLGLFRRSPKITVSDVVIEKTKPVFKMPKERRPKGWHKRPTKNRYKRETWKVDSKKRLQRKFSVKEG